MIRAIWAQDVNGVVGVNGDLPWHNSTDLQWFKQKTFGSVVVMGHRTALSLPVFPLPGRVNVVVDHTAPPGVTPVDGFLVVPSVEEALESFGSAPDVWVIGGTVTWERAMDYISEVYVTRMDLSVDTSSAKTVTVAPTLPETFIATEYIYRDDPDIQDVVKYERLV